MWINNPELTSEQKHEIYMESMEKAMDAGTKLALELVGTYRENLAEKYIAIAGGGGTPSEKAECLMSSLTETFVVFDSMMPQEAKSAAEKFIHLVQWGEE